MKFFDSHCHLNLIAEKMPIDQVLSRALKNRVKRILVPAINQPSWQDLIKLKKQYAQLDIAFGLHPYFLKKSHYTDDLLQLEQLLSANENSVAVGEIGLDFSAHILDSVVDKQKQIDIFYQQLMLAKQVNLPVIIHHRQSIDNICQLVRQAHFDCGGVVHAFSGSFQQAKKLVDLGFKLGVGGTITYERAQKTRAAVEQIPSEHLLLETDAPDMPICGRQGEINLPEYLPEIFKVLQQIKKTDATQLAEILWQNTFNCLPTLN
ncbi:TatD family hydrolase [Catenovulum sediminis]|uniref:TatD family hydrolase n=1 Tax=Catenovulum sediminis TaxID=1740262 RepID=A0ABV1RIW2_9ALTE